MLPYSTDEQVEFRALVRRFLAEKSPLERVRRFMVSDRGYDEALWAQMSDQLGLQGLGVAPEIGGAGAGLVELCIVQEEMGYALTASPMFSTVLAAIALQAVQVSSVTTEALRAIATDRLVATVCVADDRGSWSGQAGNLIRAQQVACGVCLATRRS